MTSKFEIEGRITTEWADKEVAHWVVGKLPLLEYAERYKPVPVIRINEDLTIDGDQVDTTARQLLNKPKFVVSGGMEGTGNHIDIMTDLWDIRALESSRDESAIAILLESDDYIRKRKSREPIISQQERTHLWSTTGLADIVIALPPMAPGKNISLHYEKIHDLIKPASWCASIDNPAWMEIVTRYGQDMLDITRILNKYRGIHASFLHRTKTMSKDEVLSALKDYSRELEASLPKIHIDSDQNLSNVSLAPLIFEELVRGLAT